MTLIIMSMATSSFTVFAATQQVTYEKSYDAYDISGRFLGTAYVRGTFEYDGTKVKPVADTIKIGIHSVQNYSKAEFTNLRYGSESTTSTNVSGTITIYPNNGDPYFQVTLIVTCDKAGNQK